MSTGGINKPMTAAKAGSQALTIWAKETAPTAEARAEPEVRAVPSEALSSRGHMPSPRGHRGDHGDGRGPDPRSSVGAPAERYSINVDDVVKDELRERAGLAVGRSEENTKVAAKIDSDAYLTHASGGRVDAFQVESP